MIMATKNHTPGWRSFRKQVRAQAARLEKQAATTRLVAVGALLHPDELARLARLTSAFVAALETNDPDVRLWIRNLLPRAPLVIATWVRIHLDSLEARFAS
jgi:hypothetical protein